MRDVCWWLRADDEPGDRHVRVDMPVRALGARVRTIGVDSIEHEHADGGTAVLRLPHTRPERQALDQFRALGVRVVVDCDDYMLGPRMERLVTLNVTPLNVSAAQMRAATLRTRGWQQVLTRAVERADAITVTCPTLADAYRPLNANMIVIPNQVDPDDWAPIAKPSDDLFRVGFAGSSSHVDDLHQVRDALAWASGQDGVEVVLLGKHPAELTPEREHDQVVTLVQEAQTRSNPDVRARLLAEAREIVDRQAARWAFPLNLIPWTTDYRAYARSLLQLDVGLCPADNRAPYTPYRGDLKPLEYAMAGALPMVAARARAFTAWDGRVPTAGSRAEFVDLVRWAVTHRDEVRQRAADVREYVLRERTIATSAPLWEQAVSAPVGAG